MAVVAPSRSQQTTGGDRTSRRIRSALKYILLVLLALVALTPFILAFLGTFKTDAEIIAYPPENPAPELARRELGQDVEHRLRPGRDVPALAAQHGDRGCRRAAVLAADLLLDGRLCIRPAPFPRPRRGFRLHAGEHDDTRCDHLDSRLCRHDEDRFHQHLLVTAGAGRDFCGQHLPADPVLQGDPARVGGGGLHRRRLPVPNLQGCGAAVGAARRC